MYSVRMKFLIAIALIGGIALVGPRVTFLRKQFGLGIRNIFFTGAEYILLGLFLGGGFLNILDGGTILKLEPFLVFGLGWVGILYGLQFEIKLMKGLPRKFFSITAIQALVTFLVVSAAMFVMFCKTGILPEEKALIISLVLGIAALTTAQSALAMVNRSYTFGDQRLIDLLRYIAGVDGLFAMGLFALFLAFTDPGTVSWSSSEDALLWALFTLFTALVPTLIFLLMNRTRYVHGDFLLFLTGIIAFISGMAHYLGLSPLLSGLLTGVALANTCKFRVRALNFLREGEKPIYVIMLIILGAGWDLSFPVSIGAVVLFILARVTGKTVGSFTAVKPFRSAFTIPRGIGFALLSQGGITFGIIINFVILYPELSHHLVYIAIISALFFELISPRLITVFFRDRVEKQKGERPV